MSRFTARYAGYGIRAFGRAGRREGWKSRGHAKSSVGFTALDWDFWRLLVGSFSHLVLEFLPNK